MFKLFALNGHEILLIYIDFVASKTSSHGCHYIKQKCSNEIITPFLRKKYYSIDLTLYKVEKLRKLDGQNDKYEVTTSLIFNMNF